MKLPIAFGQSNQNVVNLITKLQAGGVKLPDGSTYTAKDFNGEWKSGGKQYIERYWRDSANTPVHGPGKSDTKDLWGEDGEPSGDDSGDVEREMMQGKHEWIPTNYLGYVVEWSVGGYDDIRWVYLAEVLRIPTRLVVIHPRKLRAAAGQADPLGLQGHVGAVYIRKSGRYTQRTKGQSTFHDELRQLVRTSLSGTCNDVARYQSAFWTHVDDWYWTGDIASAAAACGMSASDFTGARCPYFFNSGRSRYQSWGATMGEMAHKLSEGWKLWSAIARNQFAAGSMLNPR